MIKRASIIACIIVIALAPTAAFSIDDEIRRDDRRVVAIARAAIESKLRDVRGVNFARVRFERVDTYRVNDREEGVRGSGQAQLNFGSWRPIRFNVVVNPRRGRATSVRFDFDHRPGNGGGSDRPPGRSIYRGMIVNQGNANCLDLVGGSDRNRAGIATYPCYGRSNQQWEIVQLVGRDYAIVSRDSGKVVEVAEGRYENGAYIQQFEWNGSDAQRWRLEPNNRGSFRIINKRSGKCLSVTSGIREDGARVQQYECHGQASQLWRLANLNY